MPIGTVRRSQLITTYGIGSLIAVEDESFMVAGIDEWNADEDLHEPRLERKLRVFGFATPPASEKRGDIPVLRFPRMYYCRVCRSLQDHSQFTDFSGKTCGECESPLVPSRFVVACENGHLDEFPYFNWVHAGAERESGEHHLSIDATGTTASLRDIVISCSCGVKSVSMDGAFSRDALRGLKRCSGRRAWLCGSEREDCHEIPRTLQRGSANVWFAVTQSALSIPPWSEGAFRLLDRVWRVVRNVPDSALKPTLEGMALHEGSPYQVDDLVEAAIERKAGASMDGSVMAEVSLRPAEFEALSREHVEAEINQDFVTVRAELRRIASMWFEDVMLVPRLREVRALTGFTRVQPRTPGGDLPRIATLSKESMGWLPAIEVKGEGVFLRLSEDRLKDWQEREPVQDRIRRINANYVGSFSAESEPDRVITPRLILIHSLAHALINERSLYCGYPAASLRERLYYQDGAAGVLLYTATTDSAGSLGGIVMLGEGVVLDDTLKRAIQRAAWCSSDPVCLESPPHGIDGLNLAACHTCLLLPEVSCEERNILLDRALLVGDGVQKGVGFFEELLQHG